MKMIPAFKPITDEILKTTNVFEAAFYLVSECRLKKIKIIDVGKTIAIEFHIGSTIHVDMKAVKAQFEQKNATINAGEYIDECNDLIAIVNEMTADARKIRRQSGGKICLI